MQARIWTAPLRSKPSQALQCCQLPQLQGSHEEDICLVPPGTVTLCDSATCRSLPSSPSIPTRCLGSTLPITSLDYCTWFLTGLSTNPFSALGQVIKIPNLLLFLKSFKEPQCLQNKIWTSLLSNGDPLRCGLSLSLGLISHPYPNHAP